jgi:large subunit ribosomal protein L19
MTMTIDSIERRRGSGRPETLTVRRQSFGVEVERTFPLHSLKIERLEAAALCDGRCAKLYYPRGRGGKAARVAKRRWGIEKDLVAAPPAPDADGAPEEAATEEAPPATASEQAAELAAEAGSETEAAADTDAEAPAAGETEDSAASEDAEDEEPAAAGDSDEDSAS